MTWDTPRRCIARQILISRLCHLACLEEVFRPRSLSLSSPLNSPTDVISWENFSMILTCVRLLPRDRSYRSFEPLQLSKLKGVLFRQWQTTKRLSTMNYWSQMMWNISLGTSLSLLLTTDLRRVSNRNWNKTSIGCFFLRLFNVRKVSIFIYTWTRARKSNSIPARRYTKRTPSEHMTISKNV